VKKLISALSSFLLLINAWGADSAAKNADVVATLEKDKFVDYPTDAPERPKGYFLTETNATHTLGILMPTAETDGDVHNYIVDIEHNKIIGEVAGNADDDLDFFGHSHGGLEATWHEVNDKNLLCVVLYHGKWGERSMRVIEISDRGADVQGPRYSIAHQADIFPLISGRLEMAIKHVKKNAQMSEVTDVDFLIDSENRLLIIATGSNEAIIAKQSDVFGFSMNIVARYDPKTRKFIVLDASALKTGE